MNITGEQTCYTVGVEEQNSQPFAKASQEQYLMSLLLKVDVAKSLIILEAVIGSYCI